MADREVVICEPLCFLVNKFCHLSQSVLRRIAAEFYGLSQLIDAKERLLEDAKLIKMDVNFPHIPKRRDCANRLDRELDDILSILSLLDERKKLSSLPRYAITDPDNVPPLKLFDGDMKFLIEKINRLDDNLANFGKVLAAITAGDLNFGQSSSRFTGPFLAHADKNGFNTQVDNSSRPAPEDGNPSGNSKPDAMRNRNQLSLPPPRSWAQTVSTPIRHNNVDSDADTADTDADNPFTVVQRRSKRTRPSTSPLAASTSPTPRRRDQKQEPKQQLGRRRIVGKNAMISNDDGSAKIKAAKPLIKKAVFCIDNVDIAVDVEDMKNFVSGLNVKVISIFETKPRRRRKEDLIPEDRKAFRICIDKNDQERLLDDCAWPDYVTVSEWFFKQSQDAPRQPPARTADAAVMSIDDVDRTIVTSYESRSDPQSTIINGEQQQ